MKAADLLQGAQGRMNAAMKTVTTEMSAKAKPLQDERDPIKKQVLAATVAADIDTARQILESNVPILVDQASVMREALTGYLTITTEDNSELVQFRDNIRGLIGKTREARAAVTALRNKARWFRKLNLSAALNQSSDHLWTALEHYRKTQSQLERTWKRMEFAVSRKVFIPALFRRN